MGVSSRVDSACASCASARASEVARNRLYFAGAPTDEARGTERSRRRTYERVAKRCKETKTMTAEPGPSGNELARRRRHEADIAEWTAQILLGLHCCSRTRAKQVMLQLPELGSGAQGLQPSLTPDAQSASLADSSCSPSAGSGRVQRRGIAFEEARRLRMRRRIGCPSGTLTRAQGKHPERRCQALTESSPPVAKLSIRRYPCPSTSETQRPSNASRLLGSCNSPGKTASPNLPECGPRNEESVTQVAGLKVSREPIPFSRHRFQFSREPIPFSRHRV